MTAVPGLQSIPRMTYPGAITVLGQTQGANIPGDVAANTEVIAFTLPANIVAPGGVVRMRGLFSATCGAVARSVTWRQFVDGVEHWNFPGVAMGANATHYAFRMAIDMHIISATEAISFIDWTEQTSFTPVGADTVPMTMPVSPRMGRVIQRITTFNFAVAQTFSYRRQIIAAADVGVVTRCRDLVVDFVPKDTAALT